MDQTRCDGKMGSDCKTKGSDNVFGLPPSTKETGFFYGLDMERSNGGERAESKCRKDKDHDLWYGAGSPAEFQASSHVLSVALEWAATASSAKAVSTGCIRSAVGSSA